MDHPVDERRMADLIWYHTIELAPGVTTPGIYDHRPYLSFYGFPRDLTGRTVLDVGAASGFFSFEAERRGARVTATDLPSWSAHDFGPLYRPELTPEQAESYLRDPFEFARQARGSNVERRAMDIYDLSPDVIGTFDLVFCGSVLVHLTDPIRALWRLRSVTGQAAIVATVLHPVAATEPLALFVGHHRGDAWWFPTRPAFEAMVKSAGFTGWEWFSEFQLDYREGRRGPYHGVIRAWTTPERPTILDDTDLPAAPPAPLPEPLDAEVARLRSMVHAYEQTKFARFVRWLHPYRQWLGRKPGR